MSRFLLILALVPGCLLLPHSAENILEGVHGKTGLPKLPHATASLAWRVIFNPGQFTVTHSITSFTVVPARKRKR